MQLPEIGATVRLFPSPLPDAEPKPGRPLPLRRVQDGAGSFGKFLPDEGAERVFDYFWAARLQAGDVLLADPRAAFVRATGAPGSQLAPVGPPPLPGAPTRNP